MLEEISVRSQPTLPTSGIENRRAEYHKSRAILCNVTRVCHIGSFTWQGNKLEKNLREIA